jgi:hypothetical protein
MTQLGAVLGAAVMATVSTVADHEHFGPFHAAFWVAAVVAGMGAVAAGFVRSTSRPER